ncbi:MAG: rRNA maturation RNase YbeY [Candidatus Yanofskybacteria bacterium RIFCSPHIGHO2_01_FULL_45_42]|uniref:Endoribonuclease YbeY n=3 Tax=Candidatus Yanofskyibacteriota TaxID=1752733 RepID=A0A1F8F718_9BACT|nr:MAG: rRNA maturation RNase YbeY [Candidatus Yanofskybacteria bacterium RIFCSPHIGHO2_01_FULL_45_42]OGN16406.1 MAG: rRNA maturation RNase YbeY [Candidatus Yanofskybacteria bacterium RIFCSPHIGHO2_02_FULL_46_19]OGN26843.1 MAG: rRNA maturation RNase YbeY [Candidatus Yanofskybacteria bacterium RIFCSPLOWO2_01_FULL_45_72]OGN32427.1 MAG: rRNA maturation RNase YbeY [Candidatus Yanofskybacteria bacterium RIFCSPLOWO2_02_FULL_45_18]
MDLVFRNKIEDKRWEQDFFEKIIKTALAVLKRPVASDQRQVYLSINLIDEAEIRKLNKKYRGKNKPTDVLSFGMEDNLRKSLDKLGMNKSPIDLGDLFICLSIAKKEAKEENISMERKLAWLTVHGFLHLVGYDHEGSKCDATKMVTLEKKVLKALEVEM